MDIDEVSPGSTIYENQAGHPFHEWIVTIGDTVEDWWGEGYVIRTVDPCLVFKWGLSTKTENQAMSGGFKIEVDKYLSILLINSISSSDSDPSEIEKHKMRAVLAVAEKLEFLSDEDS